MLIFEIDFFVDQVIRNESNFEIRVKNIFSENNYMLLLEDILDGLPLKSQVVMKDMIYELFTLTIELDHREMHDINSYLKITSRTIAIPCITELVSIIANQKVSDERFLQISSEITRIINDRASIEKDRLENTKNIYLIFDRDEINEILDNKIKEYSSFVPKNKVDLYLKRITSLGLKLYKSKDFEI